MEFVVRQEIKCGNIKQDEVDGAWQTVEVGLLANGCATLFEVTVSILFAFGTSKPNQFHDTTS